MQQQPRSRSQGLSLFRSHDLTEIPTASISALALPWLAWKLKSSCR